jgi:arylsulfatase A-like enzyme
LTFLDTTYGKKNYLVFLTADHGVAHVPEFLNKNKMPAGKFDVKDMIKEVNDSLEKRFAIKNGVLKFENFQLYLNYNALRDREDTESINNLTVVNYIIRLLNKKPFVLEAYYLHDLSNINIPEPIKQISLNSYYPLRSGDIQLIPKPNYFDGGKTGTSHGDWNPYDTHIPLVWFGWNIKPGRSHQETHMTDIAATLAALLNIQMPNGCVGKVINEIIK